MKSTTVIICGLLVVLLFLLSVSGPQQTLWGQLSGAEKPTPTPVPTPQGGGKPIHRQSGGTLGLRAGAVVIVLIILGGIFLQVRNKAPQNPSRDRGS